MLDSCTTERRQVRLAIGGLRGRRRTIQTPYRGSSAGRRPTLLTHGVQLELPGTGFPTRAPAPCTCTYRVLGYRSRRRRDERLDRPHRGHHGCCFGLEASRVDAARGMYLVMADVQQEALDSAAAEIRGLGAQVLAFRFEVSCWHQ
jgi:hypothetical protein